MHGRQWVLYTRRFISQKVSCCNESTWGFKSLKGSKYFVEHLCFRAGHSRTYRFELWHIPVKIFCSMHHLSNNPIHFLTTKANTFIKPSATKGLMTFLLHCKLSQQLTELSSTPLPSLSYSLKATKEKTEMKEEPPECHLSVSGQKRNKGLTF